MLRKPLEEEEIGIEIVIETESMIEGEIDIIMIDIDTEIEREINIEAMIIQDIDQEKLGQKKLIFALIVANLAIGLMNVIYLKKIGKFIFFYILII